MDKELEVKTIDEYISQMPEEHRPRLEEIRGIIKQAVPSLNEKISWGMPTFYSSKNIVHFAQNKNFIGFYPGPEAVVFFEDELKGYDKTKGSIHFPNDAPLPKELIVKITKHNVKEPEKDSK